MDIARELLKIAREITGDTRLRTLKFKSRSSIDEDDLWGLIEENTHLTVEDINVRGNSVDVQIFSSPELDSPSVKKFVEYMKRNGFILGQTASLSDSDLAYIQRVAQLTKQDWKVITAKESLQKMVLQAKEEGLIPEILAAEWTERSMNAGGKRRSIRERRIRRLSNVTDMEEIEPVDSTPDKKPSKVPSKEARGYVVETETFLPIGKDMSNAEDYLEMTSDEFSRQVAGEIKYYVNTDTKFKGEVTSVKPSKRGLWTVYAEIPAPDDSDDSIENAAMAVEKAIREALKDLVSHNGEMWEEFFYQDWNESKFRTDIF